MSCLSGMQIGLGTWSRRQGGEVSEFGHLPRPSYIPCTPLIPYAAADYDDVFKYAIDILSGIL